MKNKAKQGLATRQRGLAIHSIDSEGGKGVGERARVEAAVGTGLIVVVRRLRLEVVWERAQNKSETRTEERPGPSNSAGGVVENTPMILPPFDSQMPSPMPPRKLPD